ARVMLTRGLYLDDNRLIAGGQRCGERLQKSLEPGIERRLEDGDNAAAGETLTRRVYGQRHSVRVVGIVVHPGHIFIFDDLKTPLQPVKLAQRANNDFWRD